MHYKDNLQGQFFEKIISWINYKKCKQKINHLSKLSLIIYNKYSERSFVMLFKVYLVSRFEKYTVY